MDKEFTKDELLEMKSCLLTGIRSSYKDIKILRNGKIVESYDWNDEDKIHARQRKDESIIVQSSALTKVMYALKEKK